MTFDSYNEFHLGDNLVHVHFLRKLALSQPEHTFRHFAHNMHIAQLAPVADVPANNVLLLPIEGEVFQTMPPAKRAQCRNAWKNAGGAWQSHPLRNSWAGYHVEWFQKLSKEMGLESPINSPRDLLFDYPAIAAAWRVGHLKIGAAVPWCWSSTNHSPLFTNFDILFINSQPGSGQFLDFDSPDCLAPMIEALLEKGHRVICTNPTRSKCPCTRDYDVSVTGIGNLSLTIPYHVMVSTGPAWPTFNVWNTLTTKLRLLMIGVDERMDLPIHIEHVSTRAAAWSALQRIGLL